MTEHTGDPRTPAAALVAPAELAAMRARIAGAEADYLADLASLVDIDCGSYTKTGVDEVGRRVAAHLEGMGARVERHPHETLGDTIVGTIDGTPGGPRLLLIGHMDTVFDPGTAAERPFRIEAGRAYGPGVTDMKSGLLAGLYAVRAIVESSADAGTGARPPFGRLTFIANPDEEIGSPSSTPIIRDLAEDADVCLVLECARANGDIVSSRKGIVDARLTIHGRAAHAGVEPDKGRSAILAAAHLTTALHDLNGRWDGVTCNVGVVAGGTRPNVVPERAHLEVDVRAVRGDDLDAAVEAIRALIAAPAVPDVTVELAVMASWRPMEKLARSGRLVGLAIGLAEDLGFGLRDAATGGASDANTTSGMGVPSLDGLGPIGGNDHSPAEYVDVDSVVPRTTLLVALILAICRDPVVRSWGAGPATGDARSTVPAE